MLKRALVALAFVSACEPEPQVIPYGFVGNDETGGRDGALDDAPNDDDNGADPIAFTIELPKDWALQ